MQWFLSLKFLKEKKAEVFQLPRLSLLFTLSCEHCTIVYFCYCSAGSPSPQSGKKTPRNNATCNRGIYY